METRWFKIWTAEHGADSKPYSMRDKKVSKGTSKERKYADL